MEQSPTYDNFKETQEYLDLQEDDMEHFLIKESEEHDKE